LSAENWIGLIGGTSWESTAIYYRILNETVRDSVGGAASAPVTIHSMNFADVAMFFEKILEIVFSGLKREITYVQFHLCLNLEKLPTYRAVPVNRVSNHQ